LKIWQKEGVSRCFSPRFLFVDIATTPHRNQILPDTRDKWRNRLPHWEVADRPHFITIRCAGTLPLKARAKIAEIHASLRTIDPVSSQFAILQRQYFLTSEKFLDDASGFQPFVSKAVCETVLTTWADMKNQHGWSVPHHVIMPNHVHFIIEPGSKPIQTLRKTLHHFKGQTARNANLILGRRGPFWQAEWFDRWLCNETESTRIIEYIHNNPIKAGFVTRCSDYPWVR